VESDEMEAEAEEENRHVMMTRGKQRKQVMPELN
jgi:hypothetical protein